MKHRQAGQANKLFVGLKPTYSPDWPMLAFLRHTTILHIVVSQSISMLTACTWKANINAEVYPRASLETTLPIACIFPLGLCHQGQIGIARQNGAQSIANM